MKSFYLMSGLINKSKESLKTISEKKIIFNQTSDAFKWYLKTKTNGKTLREGFIFRYHENH